MKVICLSKKGLDNKAIAEIIIPSQCHISTIEKKYIGGELVAIKSGQLGRRQGA